MMYVLDTNVVSELRKAGAGRADANVVAWASKVATGTLYVSAICVLELELGILALERRDPAQAAILRTWLHSHVLPAFAGRVLPVDTAVALQCAQLHIPTRRSERDAMIAATAMVHGMTVVTRNVVDFQGTGATLLNPWAP
ncbi:type II toxin-antitoxin system VapC family toxin [Paucibacter sp. R3-3]|uniref:Type II toxin-antitoxin system VapC family toxin n=1 Tax=Roseateles agri TaxID=3098619 RepID=A0ABU5DQT3_9BURK|nr:type II toxin-antitoxin system VapC family toxin [Paucibacter sp. R3-3]MDY0748682.1 type II toxin-antitoxin system VapC family toxin [Paucibacter sp. R3-3]